MDPQKVLSRVVPEFEFYELADVVTVEPVSTPGFPGNREKKREISNFAACCQSKSPKTSIEFGAGEPNSLWQRNREPFRRNRESWRQNKEFRGPSCELGRRLSAPSRTNMTKYLFTRWTLNARDSN